MDPLKDRETKESGCSWQKSSLTFGCARYKLMTHYVHTSTVRDRVARQHTCDQTRYRRDLPILGPQIRVTPDRPKLPIYMNSDFSLLPKAKTCFTITALSKFTTGSGNRTLLVFRNRLVYVSIEKCK